MTLHLSQHPQFLVLMKKLLIRTLTQKIRIALTIHIQSYFINDRVYIK